MRNAIIFAFVIIAAGCSPTRPKLTTDDDSVLFDTVYGAASTHVFIFRNDGEQATGGLTTLLHGDTRSFTIVHDQCAGRALNHAQQCSVQLQLADDLAGDYGGELVVGDGLIEASVQISGKVSPPALAIATSTTKLQRGLGGNVDFIVTNTGGARSGIIADVVDTGAIAADECSGTKLAGGKSCRVTVTVPLAVDAVYPPSVTLTAGDGLGAPAKADAILTVGDTVSFSRDSLGNIDPRNVSIAHVDIGNLATMPLGDLHATITDVHGDPALGKPTFAIQSACEGLTLDTRSSCEIVVSLDPATAGGHWDAELAIFSGGIVVGKKVIGADATHFPVPISVTVHGDGSVSIDGIVLCTSTPGGVCYGTYYTQVAQSVTLGAVAGGGAQLVGWSNGCDLGPSCTITPTSDAPFMTMVTFTP